MNIVSSGTNYKIYDNSVTTQNKLPAGCYQVTCNPMTGYSLTAKPELEVLEEKLYGDIEYNINKVLRSFELVEKNLGVILSGEKGSGKTLFAKMLAKKAKEKGIPLILVTESSEGLADFLESIEQECIILFDEFEKNFPLRDYGYDDDGNYNENSCQSKLLGLFDGLSNGKKLFIITCNNPHLLSDFLMNRPGRFHYHFEITTPKDEEIREYLKDKLDPKYYGAIEEVIQLSMAGNITYDCLRALAFEINQGYPMSEIISCLNITREKWLDLIFTVTFKDGYTFTFSTSCNLLSNNINKIWHHKGETIDFDFSFKYNDVKIINGNYVLNPKDVTIINNQEDGYIINDYSNKDIESIEIIREPRIFEERFAH